MTLEPGFAWANFHRINTGIELMKIAFETFANDDIDDFRKLLK